MSVQTQNLWDSAGAPKRLSELIRCKTVTPDEHGEADFDEFLRLRCVLEKNYPRVHATLERELADGYSMLYRWRGKDGSKAPIALLAHQDVVPAGEEDWKYPPFEGRIDDGYIWGRGAIDMKGQLAAILEACEGLLSDGFRPECDVYLVFGHNEESVRDTGAQTIAKLLHERGVRPKLVLDEGAHMLRVGEKEAAFVGVCEKGYADIRLSCKSGGGHASMPGKHTVLGLICRAVSRLEKRPLKPRLLPPVKEMVRLVPELLPPGYRFFARTGIFRCLTARALAKTARGAANVTTTMAATMAKGSAMPNVLPDTAQAVINCRIAPWDSLDGVLEHMRLVIRDERISIEPIKRAEPTPVSDISGEGYALTAGCIGRMYPGTPVAPGMMLAATDSRFFHSISDCVLRFSPFRSMARDYVTMHAANERVSVRSLTEAVGFFRELISGA